MDAAERHSIHVIPHAKTLNKYATALARIDDAERLYAYPRKSDEVEASEERIRQLVEDYVKANGTPPRFVVVPHEEYRQMDDYLRQWHERNVRLRGEHEEYGFRKRIMRFVTAYGDVTLVDGNDWEALETLPTL